MYGWDNKLYMSTICMGIAGYPRAGFVILLQKGGASTDAWVIQCYKCKYLRLTVHTCSRWQISALACHHMPAAKKKNGTNK